MSACLNVADTSVIGGLTPARSAASLTMKLTARSVSELPGRRTDWNTGAYAGIRIAEAGKEAGGNHRRNEDLRCTCSLSGLSIKPVGVPPNCSAA